jgi:hypothetical protein
LDEILELFLHKLYLKPALFWSNEDEKTLFCD